MHLDWIYPLIVTSLALLFKKKKDERKSYTPRVADTMRCLEYCQNYLSQSVFNQTELFKLIFRQKKFPAVVKNVVLGELFYMFCLTIFSTKFVVQQIYERLLKVGSLHFYLLDVCCIKDTKICKLNNYKETHISIATPHFSIDYGIYSKYECK